jgi:hypothetical protein
MPKKKSDAKSTRTNRFVIGKAGFAKISEVEGIRPTAAMKMRAENARAEGQSAEEYRRTIISGHRKG